MSDVLEAVLRHGRPPRWVAWSVTSVLVAVSFLVRLALDPVYPYPFLTFIPAVFLSALLFDRGSSYLATAESVVLVLAFLMEPRGTLAWPGVGPALGLALFIGVSVTVGYLTERLRRSLEEVAVLKAQADILLAELHHRVRNDLSRVQALIHIESSNGPTGEGLEILKARIAVLGEVYSQLQPRGGHAKVDMRASLEGLVDCLRHAHQDTRPVALRIEAEPMFLPLALATDLGLIVNELVTNAFKYAFPDGRAGTIQVNLHGGDGGIVLTVADDGVGMTPDAPPRGTGMGYGLVEQLARQHGGKVRVNGNQGVSARVWVPKP